MLTQDPLTPDEMEYEDWVQWQEESANRTSSLSILHSDDVYEMAEGPLRRMVIPHGHSRQSLHKRFCKYLKCCRSTREIAFDPIIRAFDGADSLEDVLEDVPLEALDAVTW